MNKRQLMLDCLNGKPTERVPGSFWFHNQPDEKTGEKAVQAHLKLIREGDIDFVKIMDETELPFDFQTADDWKHYKPLSLHDPLLEKQYDVIKRIADAVSSDMMVFTTLFSTLKMIRNGWKQDYAKFVAHYEERPEEVASAYRALSDMLIGYCEECLKAGAEGIYFSTRGTEPGRFPEEFTHRLIVEEDRYVMEGLAKLSPYNFLHMCGDGMRLDYFYDFPCVVVNWDVHKHDLTLRQGRDAFKGKVILGGMKNHDGPLIEGPDDAIRAEVRRIVDDFGSKQGFILGADCTLLSDVNLHNIRVAMETLHTL